MPKKKAQKPDSHDNDYRALNDLKRVFGNWDIVGLHDFFSKIEYGQDSKVTIIEGTDLTSAEFRVQSKVFTTYKQIEGKSLSAQIKVSTLNSLAELSMPVMLHYVDNINKVSYWMWLDEWYEKNYEDSWENQDTKLVSIRKKKNKFKKRSKKKIRQRVVKEHSASLLRKKTQIHTNIDKDYEYNYHNIHGMDFVTVNPKHNEPRSLSFTTNEENARLVNYAIEQGVSVTFEQESFIEGLPNFGEFESLQVTLIPHIPQQNLFLKIQYFDQDNLLHEFDFIEMRLVQSGSVYKRFEGIHELSNIMITISFDAKEPAHKFIIEPHFPADPNATELYHYWSLMTKIINTKHIELYNLKTREISKISSAEGLKITSIDPESLRFLENLSKIEQQFQVEFKPSGNFEDLVVGYAEEIVNIIEKGFTNKVTLIPKELIEKGNNKNLVLIGHDRRDKIRDMIEKLDEEKFLNLIYSTVENLKISLLEHKIDLGTATQIVTSDNILYYDETQKEIESSDEDDLVEIHFEFKMDECYLIFDDWKQEDIK